MNAFEEESSSSFSWPNHYAILKGMRKKSCESCLIQAAILGFIRPPAGISCSLKHRRKLRCYLMGFIWKRNPHTLPWHTECARLVPAQEGVLCRQPWRGEGREAAVPEIRLCHGPDISNLSFIFEDLSGGKPCPHFPHKKFPAAGSAGCGAVTITVLLLLKNNLLIRLQNHRFLLECLSPIASIERADSHTNFLSCRHLQQSIHFKSFPLKLFWTETTVSSL